MALFLAAWIAGLCQFLFVGGYGFGRAYEMAAIARSLAEHGTYANPFAPAITGPTALVPPIHPLFLAALLRLFGSEAGMHIAAVFFNILANAAIAALLPRLAAVCYEDDRIGIFAGALWIVSMRLLPQWDVSYTILGLIGFCLLTARNLRRGDSEVWAIGAGALAGLLLLLNPASVFVIVPWLIWLFVRHRVSWRAATRYAAIASAAAAFLVAPWLLRNYRIWGAPVLRNSLGITLYSSNNDCAQPSLYQEAVSGCIQKTFPADSEAEAHLLRTLGEVRYDRLRTADTLRWVSSHRKRFAELTLGRIRDFWFPSPMDSAYNCYAIWGITLLSIPGVALSLRRRLPAAPLILSVWAIYPLMYYVVVSCDRYRYPILWTSLLPAGFALEAMFVSGCRPVWRPAPHPPYSGT
ncbi:MAG TPA: hypothetical protein VMB03_28150 [Bryobacteraceae bacterium]|nr:hypothetical protein [Bryobacteraceae bacterium]